MRSARSILSVRFTAVGGPTSVRRAVGGFLRYIQQRDHHFEVEKPGGIDGFLRYAAHRDRTMPQGRLFGREGDAGDRDRRELGRFVTRSVDGRSSGRAYYRMIISPEDARGLDLRRVTRSVMGQLERDAGTDGLPPWIAAEHRNTAHPHVHVVMAANRQLPDGRFRTLVINRERLSRMKISLSREIYLERGPERERDDRARQFGTGQGFELRPLSRREGRRRHPGLGLGLGFSFRRAFRRFSARYKWELEQELVRIELEEARARKLQMGRGMER